MYILLKFRTMHAVLMVSLFQGCPCGGVPYYISQKSPVLNCEFVATGGPLLLNSLRHITPAHVRVWFKVLGRPAGHIGAGIYNNVITLFFEGAGSPI